MFLRNFVFEMFAPTYFNMIIDGKKEAQLLRNEIKKEIESIKSKNNKVPGLT